MGAAIWPTVSALVRRPTFFMVLAFVVTFVVTRFVTHMIRTGRGPFRDNTVGGVHVHHAVYGIFLLLAAGALEFAYRPDPPGAQILAALFGAGAALTLDEFALWLHLDDVYWGPEGGARSTPCWWRRWWAGCCSWRPRRGTSTRRTG